MNLTTTSNVRGGANVAFRPVASGVEGAANDARTPSPRSTTTHSGTTLIAGRSHTTEPSRPSVLALVPAGTDPDLWRALTAAERAFFAHVPLGESPVYDRRPGASPAVGAPVQLRRGIHLDLRA